MTDTPPHSTLREWRTHMMSSVALCALGGIAVILTIVAPFETGSLLRAVPRFAYWLAIVVCTYSAGFLVNAVLQSRLDVSKGAMVAANGVLTGIAVIAVTSLINWSAFGYVPSASELPLFVGNVFIIAFVIAIILQVATQHHATTVQVAPSPPSLLDRIPFDKRGPLQALSVEDHYVRIRTNKGEEMILLRLSDAMREVGDTAGLQVHRSHWVALDAVASARREGDRAILTLHDDAEIPVSRRYVAAIKEAGLLPR